MHFDDQPSGVVFLLIYIHGMDSGPFGRRALRLREAFQQAVSDIEKGDGSVEVTEYVPYRRQFTAVF